MADAEERVKRPPSVIILGMHRSGTSLVAGSLEAAGLYLGNVNTWARFNQKGNRENEDIRALNERILARVGASWDRPPRAQVAWSHEDGLDGLDLIKPYLNYWGPWGFKDPRTVWTIEGWLGILPNPQIVAVVRHPALVAQSLAFRPGSLQTSYDAGLDLWEAYNAEILRLACQIRFPILHFSTDPSQWNIFATRLELIRQKLGLPFSSRQFYAPELVHQSEAEATIPRSLQSLFDKLCAPASAPFS